MMIERISWTVVGAGRNPGIPAPSSILDPGLHRDKVDSGLKLSAIRDSQLIVTYTSTMYTPDHFKVTDREKALAFIQTNSFGQLISTVSGRLFSTHIPFVLDEENSALYCHIAKANPQWKAIETQEVLVTFQGPHDYISPTWYESTGVPTWNYQVVHVYGPARIIKDKIELKNIIESMTEAYESRRPNPWQSAFKEQLLNAIIGIKIEIKELQCKFKLSQNRSAQEQERIRDELYSQGSTALSTAMKKLSQE
jgi:transcriptional regulator